MRVTVTSFSLGFNSVVVIDRVTPGYDPERWPKYQHKLKTALGLQPPTVFGPAKPWVREFEVVCIAEAQAQTRPRSSVN